MTIFKAYSTTYCTELRGWLFSQTRIILKKTREESVDLATLRFIFDN